MVEVTESVLRDMVGAIVREVHPERVILFGSRAGDGGGPDSDVDFLIIEREPFREGRSRRRELQRVRRALSAFRDFENLVDFAVQYRYAAFDDDWSLDRGETAEAVAALADFVAQKL